jgi:hypothetical protein
MDKTGDLLKNVASDQIIKIEKIPEIRDRVFSK